MFRFEATPGPHADALRRALGPALEAGALPAGAALVKENPVGSVHRLRVDGVGDIYLKRAAPRNLLERLKFLLRRSRARAEADGLAALRARGFDAPEPLAWAERRSAGLLTESFLVTRALGDVVPLAARLDVAAARAAGALARRLHDLGFYHRDLHPGNLMIRTGGALALVDLQKLVPLPSVPPGLRARDLAFFLHDLEGETAETLAAAFLDGYGADAALRGRALVATARRRRVRYASRARRCVVRSSGFRIETAAGPEGADWRIFRRADIPQADVLAAIEAHRRTIAAGEGAPGFIKADPPTTCISRQPAPGGDIAVKEFPPQGLLRGLVNLFRTHRGRQAWLAAHALLVRGIETPLPLALVEERRFGLVVGSWFLTRWLAPAEDAHLYADRRFAQGRTTAPPGNARGPWGEGGPRAPLGPRGEAQTVRAFARFVARLHDTGLYHADLKLPNFLVQEARPGEPPRFFLLDLDAVKLGVGQGITFRRRAKNLGQIEDYARFYLPMIKRTHRMRFLAEYGGDRGLAILALREVRRRWWRRERVLARKAARGEEFRVG